MSSPTFGVYDNLEQTQQRRDQQRENSARSATVSFTYKTSGQGEFVTPAPIPFDVTFIEEPRLTTGVVLTKRPDTARYRFPQVTAGVYRYDAKKNPVDEPVATLAASGTPPTGGLTAEEAKRALYVGAYLFFVVTVDPLQPPRSDGSNLALLQTQLAKQQVGSDPYKQLQVLIKEAQDALALKANPAKVEITHHLTFTGLALKGVDQGDDPYANITPRKPGV